jgi:hypothetical protein
MVRIPAFCPEHGPVPSGINVEDTTGLTLSGMSWPCPHCGRDSVVIDGTFDVVGEVVTVLSAPGWSIDRLYALQDLLQWAQATGRADPEQVARRLSEAAGDIPAIQRGGLTLDQWLGVLAILTAIVIPMLIYALQRSESVSPEDIVRIVDERIQQGTNDVPPATDPSPTARPDSPTSDPGTR